MSNISYELAVELKKAGFPQTHEGGYLKSKGKYLVEGNPESVYAPTLSELIEACGETFIAVTRFKHLGVWQAVAGIKVENEDKFHPYHLGEAPTPEEAVAKLYLALHTPSHE